MSFVVLVSYFSLIASLRDALGKVYILHNALFQSDLKENLLTDFEDRKKLIESERHSLELTSDSTEVSNLNILFSNS